MTRGKESEGTGKNAYVAALRLLSHRDRSVAELKRKLTLRGFASDDIEAVTRKLDRMGYLNDERFAREWAAAAVRNRMQGHLRIVNDLRKRGIAEKTARSAADEAIGETGELALAREALARRIEPGDDLDDIRTRARLHRYLVRKGFPASTAREAIKMGSDPIFSEEMGSDPIS